MGELILPESLKAEKEINKIEVTRYKGFLMSVIRIENNYRTKDSLVTMVKSAERDDNKAEKFTQPFKYYGFAENQDLKVSLNSMGITKNEAGQELQKKIDIIIKAKYGQ